MHHGQALSVRAATIDDLKRIQRFTRQSDLIEMKALGTGTPRWLIKASVDGSLWTEAICVGGKAVAIYGLTPSAVNAAVGLPWLIGTETANSLGMAFIRQCKPTVERMLRERPALVNLVHARNHISRRWLHWLGFRFSEPIALKSGEHFIPFWQSHQGAEAVAVGYVQALRTTLNAGPPTKTRTDRAPDLSASME